MQTSSHTNLHSSTTVTYGRFSHNTQKPSDSRNRITAQIYKSLAPFINRAACVDYKPKVNISREKIFADLRFSGLPMLDLHNYSLIHFECLQIRKKIIFSNLEKFAPRSKYLADPRKF